MCVKLFSGDLNLDSYPPHSTNIYTYEMYHTKVHGGNNNLILTILVKIKKKNDPPKCHKNYL